MRNRLGLSNLLDAAVQPVDSASVVFFRLAFGLIMAGWGWDYLTSGRVTELYVQPEFHFSYYGFEWVEPWGGHGMYFHFVLLIVLSLMIAFGVVYRVAVVGFAILFTYFFLLERTNYQNHYYLIGLIGWWMVWLPLNRNAAVDCLWRPNSVSQTVPRWSLWMLQLHIAIPYFYGGIAKLTPDWLLGQPMGLMLSRQAELPVLGPWLAWTPTTFLFALFGILFDLLVVPALMWKRTRAIAYLCAVTFHLGNSVLFNIHIFPWFMIAGSTLFFEPDWPRKFLTNGCSTSVVGTITAKWSWTPMRKFALAFMACYLAFHAVWPLRHNFYPGDASWNERGHLFAWRMMLRGKESGMGYALKDPRSGKVVNVDPKQFMSAEQAGKFGRDPEMILHFAHFLADEFERDSGVRPQVYAIVLTSLNGRKPQLLVDPNADLASIPRGIFFKREWVVPLEEPLRSPPWDLPVSEWRKHVELPKIQVLEEMYSSKPHLSNIQKDNL